MSAAQLTDSYLAAVNAFNESAFAKSRGFQQSPTPLQMAEIETLADILPAGGSLLDIGTGTGVVPDTFHRLGYRVASVDLGHKPELRKPLQRLIDLGVSGHWAEVGVDPIPLDDAAMDVVFAGDVIEHIAHSPRQFMDEVARVLKPGGWVVLTTPNAVRLSVRLKVLLGYSNWMPLSTFYESDRNFGHHKEYDRSELADLLRRSGFVDIHVGMVEDTLKMANLLSSVRDLKTQIRFGERRGNGFNPLNPMEYVRVTMAAVTSCLPNLRSAMLSQARKPDKAPAV